MKKFVKLMLIIAILIFTSFAFYNNCSYAVNDTVESTQSAGEMTTTVSSTSSINDDIFYLTITNVALIAIGIVIVLLAIAILIKLKK